MVLFILSARPHTSQHNGSLYSGHRILGFLQHRLRTADMGEWYVTIIMLNRVACS